MKWLVQNDSFLFSRSEARSQYPQGTFFLLFLEKRTNRFLLYYTIADNNDLLILASHKVLLPANL